MAKDIVSEGARAAVEAAWRPVANDTSMLQRPIFGGIFGMGEYALATMPSASNGLHAVQFLVIQPRAGTVLSVSEDKREALAAARRLLRTSDALSLNAERLHHGVQAALWPEDAAEPDPPIKSIPRRRREIYEKCGGSCHYCKRTLKLDGKWHIEHMVPKALNGGSGFTNLVASCVSCNLKKRDRTAVEFMAERGSATSTAKASRNARSP